MAISVIDGWCIIKRLCPWLTLLNRHQPCLTFINRHYQPWSIINHQSTILNHHEPSATNHHQPSLTRFLTRLLTRFTSSFTMVSWPKPTAPAEAWQAANLTERCPMGNYSWWWGAAIWRGHFLIAWAWLGSIFEVNLSRLGGIFGVKLSKWSTRWAGDPSIW